ncbi:hypothetical protein FHR24_003089 [Wenyingzhuangia heitensis]|uniref:DUF4179 domain-containing protein n=1 Tax=Wenyingzhuangia heitensis TaxID=1487859 RepID=A0ABX0UE33_9FLAO|nr:hypothetical protein [Wenyingzhuangia heitensis]NIJ46599.1 hypothetical protein [Wenyingzhuangia heitensis]
MALKNKKLKQTKKLWLCTCPKIFPIFKPAQTIAKYVVTNYQKCPKKKKRKEKRREFWIPTLLSIIAILISFYSIYNENKIAKKSGNFDKGKLKLKLGYFKLNSEKTSIVILVNESNENNILFTGIPFEIDNEGNANVLDCGLTMTYPKINGEIAVDAMKYFEYNQNPIDFKREFYEEDKFDYILYKIKKIQPGEIFSFFELTSFRNTIIKDKVETKDKDSIPMIVSYEMKIAYNSKINLKADNLNALNYNLVYHHFEKKDWDKIKNGDMIKNYLSNPDNDVYLLEKSDNNQKRMDSLGTFSVNNYKINKIRKFR